MWQETNPRNPWNYKRGGGRRATAVDQPTRLKIHPAGAPPPPLQVNSSKHSLLATAIALHALGSHCLFGHPMWLHFIFIPQAADSSERKAFSIGFGPTE